MDVTETEAWRVWEHVCQVERIEWYCKQSGVVQVILEDLL